MQTSFETPRIKPRFIRVCGHYDKNTLKSVHYINEFVQQLALLY